MLIVVVILGILAAVSVPWFGKMRRRAELRSVAMEIGTTLVAARMRAVKRNVSASVVINPASSVDGSYEINTFEPTPVVPPALTPVPTSGPNPGGQVFLSGRAIRFIETPAGGSITFDGTGRRVAPPPTTPGTIVIEGPVGVGITNQIKIDTSAGGRVLIITPPVTPGAPGWQ
jgi:type II secretory pathway pseudopilin PulG